MSRIVPAVVSAASTGSKSKGLLRSSGTAQSASTESPALRRVRTADVGESKSISKTPSPKPADQSGDPPVLAPGPKRKLRGGAGVLGVAHEERVHVHTDILLPDIIREFCDLPEDDQRTKRRRARAGPRLNAGGQAAARGGEGGAEERKASDVIADLKRWKRDKKREAMKRWKEENKKKRWYIRLALKVPILKTKVADATFRIDLSPRTQAVVTSLRLAKRQLRKIKLVFDEIDFTMLGDVSYDDVFEYMEEAKRTPFTDMVYDKIISQAGTGVLTVDDFYMVTCLICSYNQEDVLRLIFDTFDRDKSGVLEENEFVELCALVNAGTPFFAGNYKKAMEEFDVNADGVIDMSEFTALHKKYPMVLWPVFKMQDEFRKRSLGEAEWLEVVKSLIRYRRDLLLKKQGKKRRTLREWWADHKKQRAAEEAKKNAEIAAKVAAMNAVADAGGVEEKASGEAHGPPQHHHHHHKVHHSAESGHEEHAGGKGKSPRTKTPRTKSPRMKTPRSVEES